MAAGFITVFVTIICCKELIAVEFADKFVCRACCSGLGMAISGMVDPARVTVSIWRGLGSCLAFVMGSAC